MRFFVTAVCLLCLSCSHTYYVVRHAERATAAPNMSSDVSLSDAGQQRALSLKEVLKGKKITEVYSTNTIRTKSTAQPTADHFGQPIQIYGPRPDTAFIQLLKTKRKNVLVVGHSNTVDDVVNMLCGKPVVASDLPESEYDNLFIIKMKGKRAVFERRKY